MILQKTSFTFITLAVFGLFSLAQTPVGIKRSSLTGDALSVGKDKIVLGTKDGEVDIILSDKTAFKRVPADNPTLKAVVAAVLTDINAGDKLLVTGILSDDKRTLSALAVYLMTRSDIAEKQIKDSEKWNTRGISGRVASVNAEQKQITIEIRGLANSTNIVLAPKSDAKFRRYAPDSVKFSEAKTSSLEEIKAGDMLRALGDRSSDGTSFAAEEIVTGTFQTVAGTVKAIDAAKNEVVIGDHQSGKDVTVYLGSASMLKKFPEEMAQRMAQFQAMRAANGAPPQRQGDPGRGGSGGGPRGSIDEMLERFPNITVADLKAGDMIAVSSTKTADAENINAIKLLADVEPFLKAAQATNVRARGGQTGSFTIPGLDGFDVP